VLKENKITITIVRDLLFIWYLDPNSYLICIGLRLFVDCDSRLNLEWSDEIKCAMGGNGRDSWIHQMDIDF